MAGNGIPGNGHVAHFAVFDIGQEIRKGDCGFCRPVVRWVEHLEQQQDQRSDNRPQEEILTQFIHVHSLPTWRSRTQSFDRRATAHTFLAVGKRPD
ncbi:MAG: hypothetical protein AAEJ43_02415, partial [Gammaproteobacteria bacterium]